MLVRSLKEAKKQFNIANKVLKELYGIGQEEFEDAYPYDADEEGYDDSLKEDEKINQIREITLQGLQDYAHDVDTEKYQFYKKIWLMCDKAMSEKENVGDSKD